MAHIKPEKKVNLIVSAEVANHPVLYAEAGRVQANALALAARHNKTGNYAGKIAIVPGRVDVHVQARDPAAVHIEFGHKLSGNPAKGGPKGKAEDGTNKVTVRRNKLWVNGLHIMRNAAIMAGGDMDRG